MADENEGRRPSDKAFQFPIVQLSEIFAGHRFRPPEQLFDLLGRNSSQDRDGMRDVVAGPGALLADQGRLRLSTSKIGIGLHATAIEELFIPSTSPRNTVCVSNFRSIALSLNTALSGSGRRAAPAKTCPFP
jgi:hypothetical protein